MRFAIFVALLCMFSLSSRAQNTHRLAIPSYAYPSTKEWKTWESLGSQTVGIMVLNLNNGDDTRLDESVATSVKHTQESGILVLGYIHTGYAQRDPAEVRAKIDAVVANYKVDGIFLDETPTDCGAPARYGGSNGAYYDALTSYIRSKPGKHMTVLNPGTMPLDDCWMKFADILLTFEEATLANYQQHYVDREWLHRYPPERFWHLVYSVGSADQMLQIVSLAQQRGAGWLYVTDDGPDKNPWDDPATYLAAEAQAWTGVAHSASK